MLSRPSIPDVLDAFRAYHTEHPMWGSLHIVLADGNVADSHVQFCIGCAQQDGDAEGERLARVLLSMSKTQRLRLGGIA